MSYISMIRVSLNKQGATKYQDINSAAVGHPTKKKHHGPYVKIGSFLYSVNSGGEKDVLNAIQSILDILKNNPKALDYINITIAKES